MGAKEYFCGWYFKCQSEEESIAVIPAVHRADGKQSCSIQLISSGGSWNIPLDCGNGCVSPDRPFARMGRNVFTEKGLYLELRSAGLSVDASLSFGRPSPLNYDIMGPFCCVPFMECRHRIFSMRHEVNGSLTLNGKTLRFDKALGYIEGDRGRSFPRQYMWSQCFFDGGSLSLAAAEIPLGPHCFTGVIALVQLNGQEYRLATYLGARVLHLENCEIAIRQGALCMTAALLDQRGHELKAPACGAMTRTIRENLNCRVRYQLREGDRLLLDFESDRASFEYEYLL